MAIAVRAVSTGANNNATSQPTTLPTGTTTGDVTILAAGQSYAVDGAGIPTLSAPAGWTTLVNFAGVLVCWRKWVSGDTTTPTVTSTKTDFWISGAITYSGLDGTTPIDVYASAVTAKTVAIGRAPPIVPNFVGDQLLAIFINPSNIGTTVLSLPSGYTTRVSSAPGPAIRMCDKLLTTSGAQTGYAECTGGTADNANVSQFGMSIGLHASGAAAATPDPPLAIVAGSWDAEQANAFTVPLNILDVRNNDLLVLVGAGTEAIVAPSGWTQIGIGVGSQAMMKRWATGDTLAPSFEEGVYFAADLFVLRRSGSGTNIVSLDTYGSAAGLTGIAVAPSLTPFGANELLIVHHGGRDGNAHTFSGATAGLTKIETTYNGGPNARTGWLSNAPATATTAFSLTQAGSAPLDAWCALFGLGLASATPLPCAITVRGVSQGPYNAGSTSHTITLPSGRVANDLTIVCIQFDGTATLSAVTGWTTLHSSASLLTIIYRKFVAGDAATLALTSSAPVVWSTSAIAYIGCDTTTPIDTSGYCAVLNLSTLPSRGRAPSVNPNFLAEKLVAIYGYAFQSTLIAPLGATSRIGGFYGRPPYVVDMTLVDGTPTAALDVATTASNSAFPVMGVAIALKPAGATAATVADPVPTWAGLLSGEISANTFGLVDLSMFSLQTGDLLLILASAAATVTFTGGLIAGGDIVFTTVTNVAGAQIFSHVWNTATDRSDNINLNLSVTGNANFAACVFRKSGTGTGLAVLDTSGVTSATGTAAVPALTPAGAGELLLAWWGTRTTSAGTLSAVTPAGLTIEHTHTLGPASVLGWQSSISGATSAYSSTLSSRAIDAWAGLVKISSSVVAAVSKAFAVIMS